MNPKVAARIAAIVDGGIEIKVGAHARMVRQAEAALGLDPPMIFQRGSSLVRPGLVDVEFADKSNGFAPALHLQNSASIYGAISERTEWFKYDERTKKRETRDPPPLVSKTIANRAGHWKRPSISGCISCPTLRPDGSLLSARGYDPATRLYNFWEKGDLGLGKASTREQAEEGLEDLGHLLAEFPFRDDVDRAAALSGLISPVVRAAMDGVPLHGVTATAAGSGKSLFVDLCAMIATGRRCPVQTASADPRETEKRLVASLLAALPLISLDNLNCELQSSLLCQGVSGPLILVRPLGTSTQVEIENSAVFYATGNGFGVSDDLVRRTIICRLDAKVQFPEHRNFDGDPIAMIAADRARYISAALHIARAFLSSGETPESLGLMPLAGFDMWTKMVRAPIVWLGCADPVVSMEESRKRDSRRSALVAAVNFLDREFGANPFSVASVIGRLTYADGLEREPYEDDAEWTARQEEWKQKESDRKEMRELFLSIAGIKGAINGKSLTGWLKRNLGRMVEGDMRIDEAEPDRHMKALRFKIAKY